MLLLGKKAHIRTFSIFFEKNEFCKAAPEDYRIYNWESHFFLNHI